MMSQTNPDIEQLINNMAQQLTSASNATPVSQAIMIGIHTGGAWVAERLHQQLGLESALCRLDISFYRDDFTRIGFNPQVKPSDIPVNLDDQHIILVDDVLHTGRTIRAALNEIFDYGRPASITLAVLIERSGRELPIQADITGMHLELTSGQHVKIVNDTSGVLKIDIIEAT